MEDEILELELKISCHQDDVAMFIDECEDLEELVKDLKDYFELNDEYYAERKKWKDIVQKVIDEEEK